MQKIYSKEVKKKRTKHENLHPQVVVVEETAERRGQ